MNKFDISKKRKGTNSIKWDFANIFYPNLKGDNILSLSVADMDFDCSFEILKSLDLRLQDKIFGYSYFDLEYYEIIKKWFKENYSYELTYKNINYSPGVIPGIGALIRALTNVEDEIIIQPPVYGPFKDLILENDRKPIFNPLINNNGYYSIDFEDLEEKAKNPNVKMLIFCSPHNPVGRVWKKEEIEKIVSIVKENNLYLISDEIHCDLIRKNISFTSLGLYKDILKEKLVICTAPSKSFNLAGLQLANIIIFSSEIRKKWKKELGRKMHITNPNSFSINATKAAYKESKAWLEDVNIYIEDNLIFLKKYLDENLPKLKYEIPEGTYLAWIDFSSYNLSHEEIIKRVVYKEKLVLNNGKTFGEEGEKFLRMNVACSRDVLKLALGRLLNALK